MRFLAPPDIPEVDALPAAGNRGLLLVLTTDSHLYYDDGTSWVDISAGGASTSATTLGQDYASNRGCETV